jgi:hypothetical protein
MWHNIEFKLKNYFKFIDMCVAVKNDIKKRTEEILIIEKIR